MGVFHCARNEATRLQAVADTWGPALRSPGEADQLSVLLLASRGGTEPPAAAAKPAKPASPERGAKPARGVSVAVAAAGRRAEARTPLAFPAAAYVVVDEDKDDYHSTLPKVR